MICFFSYTNLDIIQPGWFDTTVQWTIYVESHYVESLSFLMRPNYLLNNYFDLHMGNLA